MLEFWLSRGLGDLPGFCLPADSCFLVFELLGALRSGTGRGRMLQAPHRWPLLCYSTASTYNFCWLFSHSVISNSLWSHGLLCVCPSPLSLGILQTRILEWVPISYSRGSSQPRDRTRVSCFSRWILYHLSHQGHPPAITQKQGIWGFPGGSAVDNPPAHAGDVRIVGSVCGQSMDRGGWRAPIHEVTKESDTI